MRNLCLLAAGGLLIAGSASATATYNWHSVTSGPYAQMKYGQIEVTNRAYQAGSLSISLDRGPDGYYEPSGYTSTVGDEPVRIQTGKFGDRFVNSPLIYAGMTHVPGYKPIGAASDSAFIAPRQQDQREKKFGLNLTFNDNGTLSGTFDMFGLRSNFDSEGDGYSWQVSDVNSDAYTATGHCTGNYSTPCSGGSGYWNLAKVTPADVPAPPAWGLFGLAALAAFSVGFRRKA